MERNTSVTDTLHNLFLKRDELLVLFESLYFTIDYLLLSPEKLKIAQCLQERISQKIDNANAQERLRDFIYRQYEANEEKQSIENKISEFEVLRNAINALSKDLDNLFQEVEVIRNELFKNNSPLIEENEEKLHCVKCGCIMTRKN